jgi:hypothetical protein
LSFSTLLELFQASFPEYSSEQVWKCNLIMLEEALLYEDSILYQLVSKEAIGFKSLEVNIKIICCDRKEFNIAVYVKHCILGLVLHKPLVFHLCSCLKLNITMMIYITFYSISITGSEEIRFFLNILHNRRSIVV